jgi:hypothetical protein
MPASSGGCRNGAMIMPEAQTLLNRLLNTIVRKKSTAKDSRI